MELKLLRHSNWLKQADIEYNVANQATKEGLGAASDIAKTANSIRKTNNGRQYAGA